MAHILLVHGAWHGAWCWYRLIPELEARGFTVHAVDLPGHGLRVGEAQSLPAYAQAVADALEALPEPAILLGHSMGGQVISAAAERAPDRVSRLVYLCAFLTGGLSLLDASADDPEGITGQFIRPRPDGLLEVADEGLRPTFYADCGEADLALARLLLTPQSIEPLAAPVTLTPERYGRVPRSYIVCDQDRALGPTRQRQFAERGEVSKQAVLNTSHSPFFSAPGLLADAVVSVV